MYSLWYPYLRLRTNIIHKGLIICSYSGDVYRKDSRWDHLVRSLYHIELKVGGIVLKLTARAKRLVTEREVIIRYLWVENKVRQLGNLQPKFHKWN